MTKKNAAQFFVLSLLASSALVPATAAAQAASDSDAENTRDEIIVTVERREQGLQDLAATASNFDSDMLALTGVSSVENLDRLLPGLQIGNQEGNIEIFIRGIGSDNNTELGDPAAATHIDGVYIPRPSGLSSVWHDIERVEVNVGPQGTLRGRNATAGTLNIISRKPELGVLSAETEVEFGNYDTTAYRAVLNIPLSQTAAFRVSGMAFNRDSFYTNVGPTANSVTIPGEDDDFGVRAQLLVEPNDRLRALFSFDYNEEKGTGYPVTNVAAAIGFAGLRADELADPRRVVYGNGSSSEDTTHWGGSANITYDFGGVSVEYLGSYRQLDFSTLQFNPLTPEFPGVDAFFTDANINQYNIFQWERDSNSIIQELRLFSADDARLRWTVGGFYLREDQYTFLGSTDDRAPFFLGIEFNQPDTNSQSLSFYGDATYDLTDRLRITGGVRWTDEKKSRFGGIGVLGGIGGIFGADGSGPRIGTPGFEFAIRDRTIFDPDIDGDGVITNDERLATYLDGISSFGVADDFQTLLNAGNAGGISVTAQNASVGDKFVDWRARLAYDVTDNNLLYALVSTGHTAPGLNDNITPTIAPTYRGEKVTLYEIGSKNEFKIGGRNATLNISAFYNDYQDQVFQSLISVQTAASIIGVDPGLLPGGGGSIAFRFNAAESSIKGVNIEGGIDLPGGMHLSTNILYLDAKFDKGEVVDPRFGAFTTFPNADPNRFFGPFDPATQPNFFDFLAGPPFNQTLNALDFDGDGTIEGAGEDLVRDLKGNRLPRSPKWSANVNLSQSIDLPRGSLDWLLNVAYRGTHFLTPFNGTGVEPLTGEPVPSFFDKVSSYVTVDFGAGYNFDDDGNLRLEGYVSNLTQKTYATSQLSDAFNFNRWYNAPRTYGMRLKAKLQWD